MKALAELVMRGRLPAALLALLCAALPMLSWLAAAIVVLITLRKGGREGALILLAALAPSVLMGEKVEVITVSAVLVAYISASVLRSTVNLSYSLLSLFFCSALLLIGLINQPEGVLELLKQILESQLTLLEVGSTAGIKGQDFVHLLAVQSISYGIGLTALVGLLVGRWWQATLFNPGGFQKEFHALRFSPFMTILLFMLSIVGFGGAEVFGMMGTDLPTASAVGDHSAFDSSLKLLNVAAITSLMTLPLLITGAAIVHSIVKAKHAGVFWLVGFYITLPITNTMVYLMVLVDGFVDIRSRLGQQPDS